MWWDFLSGVVSQCLSIIFNEQGVEMYMDFQERFGGYSLVQ